MASVTQCDVCNNVIKHEESKYIKIYNVNKEESIPKQKIKLELEKSYKRNKRNRKETFKS